MHEMVGRFNSIETNFISRLGSMQYYAKETRDDIAAAVNMIAQKCKAPTVGAVN